MTEWSFLAKPGPESTGININSVDQEYSASRNFIINSVTFWSNLGPRDVGTGLAFVGGEECSQF